MHHPTDRITHTMAFVTPVVEHWLEGEIAQWVHPMDRSDNPSRHERSSYHGATSRSVIMVNFYTNINNTIKHRRPKCLVNNRMRYNWHQHNELLHQYLKNNLSCSASFFFSFFIHRYFKMNEMFLFNTGIYYENADLHQNNRDSIFIN